MNVDPNKGELWVTMDQLEKRWVTITSLHSKNMYKNIYKFQPNYNFSSFRTDSFIKIDTCKFTVTETSIFMINIFLYSHLFRNLQLIVTTADDGRQNAQNPRNPPGFNPDTNLFLPVVTKRIKRNEVI